MAGPRPTRSGTRRRVLAAVLALALVALAFAAYGTARPEPPGDLSLTDLQVAYGNLSSTEGSGDPTTLNLNQFAQESIAVRPSTCRSLVNATLGRNPPSEALDGVSSSGLDGDAAVALFTLRFVDSTAALRVYGRVEAALSDCVGATSGITVQGEQVQVSEIAHPPGAGGAERLSYLLRGSAGGPYGIYVLAYANTVTWQFRRSVEAEDAAAARRLSDRLVAELDEVPRTEGR